MKADLSSVEKEGVAAINTASTLSELLTVEKNLFGRKNGSITLHMQSLRSLSPEEKKREGVELNRVKNTLQNAFAKKRATFEQEKLGSLEQEDALDSTMDLPARDRGHLHLIPEFIRQVEEVFGRMGFDVAYGPQIETEEYNFDLLNIPADHPARDVQDTFWMTHSKGSNQEDGRVLRTHTSPVQIRYAREHKPPFRMICPGVVYRKDADATHSPMFHQFEGMMIGKDISLRHLKGVMITAMKELLSTDLEFRFRTGYFPFTEPSMEMDIRWQGETETKEGQWLEVAGCGMTHPNVLGNCGIDPKEWQGFAFGFGVERLVMIKHQIPNIRSFYQGDLRFLGQF
jgi:phenylalanyl-tRNA synthetase alpha chain